MDDISQRSIIMSRSFNAPVDLVWQALTTPEYVKEWWGPEGFSITIHKMDVREGGKWEFIMHGPDGTDYENDYVYSIIIPLKKIVLDHQKKPKFTIIIAIQEKGTKTNVEWRNVFDSVPSKEEAIRSVKADKRLEHTLNHLSDHLKKHI